MLVAFETTTFAPGLLCCGIEVGNELLLIFGLVSPFHHRYHSSSSFLLTHIHIVHIKDSCINTFVLVVVFPVYFWVH